MTYRSMTADDAVWAARLYGVNFPTAWSENMLADSLALPHCEGVCDNALSGFILLQKLVDEAEILTLAIKPDLRRQGLARNLLNYVITQLMAESRKFLHLEVAIDNLPASGFYRQMGFVETGKRENYYQHPTQSVDALLMRLCI